MARRRRLLWIAALATASALRLGCGPSLKPPANVTASTDSVRSIRLSWTPVASLATEWQVRRRLEGAGSYEFVAALPRSATGYLDRGPAGVGLEPNTGYDYIVQGVHGSKARNSPIANGRTALPAFPGAEGYGASTPGGRGGLVYIVKTLCDYLPAQKSPWRVGTAPSNPGCSAADDDLFVHSLRFALTEGRLPDDSGVYLGPRMVVFQVAGTLHLMVNLIVGQPFVTISGARAPHRGVTVRVDPDQGGAAFRVRTHDVVFRHLRIRNGPKDPAAGHGDAIWLEGRTGTNHGGHVRNAIFDHLSLSWATDENFGVSTSANCGPGFDETCEVTDITVQNTILAEAQIAPPEKGFGTLLSGMLGTGRFSFHRNLWMSNPERNPSINVDLAAGPVDMVNNAIYNYGKWASFAGDLAQEFPRNVGVNFVGNHYQEGPNLNQPLPRFDRPIELRSYTEPGALETPIFEIWLDANRYVDANGVDVVTLQEDMLTCHYNTTNLPDCSAAERDEMLIESVHPTPPLPTSSADQARIDIANDVGALVNGLRDAVDIRLLDEFQTGGGRHVSEGDLSEADYPPLDDAGPPLEPDLDLDGMADSWETAHVVDDPSGDPDGDTYTNLEEYLDDTDPNVSAWP